MKKNIFNTILIGASLLTFASCDVNDWNDGLEGFVGDPEVTDVQTIEYTLTDADYALVASNSTNKALAGADNASALAAVGTKHYFTNVIKAQDYIPAFLADADFPYFTLDNGSAIKVTYNVVEDLPAEIAEIEAADTYEISEFDYINYVWENDENYVNSFAPSKTAAKYLPEVLKNQFDDAQPGDYKIVTFNTSNQEPVFGSADIPEVPAFELSSVLGSIELGGAYDVNGVITALCNRGYILTDNTGSILVYYASGFNLDDWKIGDQLKVSGTITSYGTAFQIAGPDATIEVVGNQAYNYPAPVVMDGAAFDAAATRADNELAIYAQFTGTTLVSGNYYNFNIEGAEASQGSLYQGTADQKALFTDGEQVTVTGYFVSVSSKKFVNFVVTDVKSASKAAATKSARLKAVPTIPTVEENAVYYFDGSKWTAPSNIVILNPADYTAMGQKYGNLSAPDTYLPTFLKTKYPYAQADAKYFVVYKYYSNSATTIRCDQYVFNGTEWAKNEGIVSETAQFVKNKGEWKYDPSVTVSLPARSDIATTYYQACVDWVYENIDKPLGSTGIKEGKYYVSSYGNNEYYCGTSAYYGNVDIRPAKAIEQYPDGYAGMTETEVLALMKKRFETEVMPGALAKLHPDAVPVEGIDVVFTINFITYEADGGSYDHTARFKVVGPAQFELIDCTWNN